MDQSIRAALTVDMVVDITTTGRSTGQPRRIEIWAHCVDGQVLITGSPGRRSWFANLVAEPSFTFHLKGDTTADLSARALPITGEDQRRAVFTSLAAQSAFRQGQGMDNVDAWVRGSALVEVVFPE